MNTPLLHFSPRRSAGPLVLFFAATIGLCFLLARKNQAAGLASVSIIAYTNILGERHAVLAVSNGHSWPVEFYAGMPEVKNSTGWRDLWTDPFDYRLILDVDRGDTRLFTQPVPTNPEPTRIRFLCYRAETRIGKLLRDGLERLGVPDNGKVPYRVYSGELAK